MVRNRRPLAWCVALALICTSFFVARQPAAIAAGGSYVVDNARDGDLTADANACIDALRNNNCTLRQAIERANADAGASTITFDIPPDSDPNNGYDGSFWTVKPDRPLPPLDDTTGGTTIVGTLIALTPRIIIDGTLVPPSSAVGLTLSASSNTIRNMVIGKFTGDNDATGVGILIDSGATGNRIEGNYIGTKPIDNTSFPNSGAGIRIDGASGNTIGSETDENRRNFISGNTGSGIYLNVASGNFIYGNYIGLALGSGPNIPFIPLGNSLYGIYALNSSGTTIGGTTSVQRNIISGNGKSGILLTGNQTQNNTITSNFIGLSPSGTAAVGNGEDGVQIANGAKNNTVSGTESLRSLISANGRYGVLITDGTTRGNHVLGNYIGVNDNGTTRLGNAQGGLRLQDNANNNIIGAAGQGNVIAGNTGYGISFGRSTAGFTSILSNTVAGNFIGLNSTATTVVSNTLGGVLVSSGALSNRIGGVSAGEQNIISGNGGPGIVITGTATLSTTVAGNVIGLRRASAILPFVVAAENKGDGVLIEGGARYTRVGGAGDAANTIAANTANGVHVTGAATISNTIQSNYLGVALDGSTYVALGNKENGVLVDGGAQEVAILSNHISSNGGRGIALSPSAPAPGGTTSNANHDIDPPFDLHLNQRGRLTGRVLVAGGADSCGRPCQIQIFTADPVARDQEGRDLITPTDYTLDATGHFTATLPGAFPEELPAQLALTATDAAGNTSEFSVLTSTLTIDIGPPRASDAVPGQVITYTHRITNTGSIDFLGDLSLSAASSRGWTVSVTPTEDISLAAGESKPITVTVQIPPGPGPSVTPSPPVDETVVTIQSTSLVTVTDSVTDLTTILPRAVIEVIPVSLEGFGTPTPPNNVVTYPHILRNIGNVAASVTITATTDLGWATSVTTTTLDIEPGATNGKGIAVSVTVPPGAEAGTRAHTTITVDVVGFPAQQRVFTDTTTVELNPSALLIHVGAVDLDAVPGDTVPFTYRVENRSNGPETFSLRAVPSSAGTVVAFTRADGELFGPGYTFFLDNTVGTNVLTFTAEVHLSTALQKGDEETITISVLDHLEQTRASRQNHIVATQNGLVPRAYLPLVWR
jgi:hypothetical protein